MIGCNTLEEVNALLNDQLFFKIINNNMLNNRSKIFWATDFIAAYSGKFHTILFNISSAKETDLTFLQDTGTGCKYL